MSGGISEQYTAVSKMQQSERQHRQWMRAQALSVATMILAAGTPEVKEIVDESAHLPIAGTRRLELLANHILTFIETGEFIDSDGEGRGGG